MNMNGGDIVTDEIDFQIMLTFDYSLPDPFPETDTIKKARTRYLLQCMTKYLL